MSERRSLLEAVKNKPPTDRALEEEFIYGGSKGRPPGSPARSPQKPETPPAQQTAPASRVPFTTRVRADLAKALKHCSLERQLKGVEPNTVQDILEAALEPWLKANGYLQ